MKYRKKKRQKWMLKTGCLLWIGSVLPSLAGTFNLGSDVTISESEGLISVEVTRSNPAGEATIEISTSTLTALKGVDFEAIDSRTLDFPDGVNTASFPILITDDNYSECEETFVVSIDSVPAGDSVSGGTLTVTVEDDDLMDLIWDDGSERNGSNGVYVHPDNQEGIYCFRVNTAPANEFDLWRTVLLVSAGEADLAIHRGPFGADERADHESAETGSDGILLTDSQFNPAQEWYIRVNAQPGAEWSLFTGDIHVIQQGELLLDTDPNYAPIQTTFPPEGALFVQAETTVDTRAWAIWLNGYAKDSDQADIAIKKNTPSLPSLTTTYDFLERNQSLMTPPYLGEGSDAYFFLFRRKSRGCHYN
jgi:hypothetical protein